MYRYVYTDMYRYVYTHRHPEQLVGPHSPPICTDMCIPICTDICTHTGILNNWFDLIPSNAALFVQQVFFFFYFLLFFCSLFSHPFQTPTLSCNVFHFFFIFLFSFSFFVLLFSRPLPRRPCRAAFFLCFSFFSVSFL
jgi:hypothetical protein